jgi:Fur family transcriptional regulator, ferric uptake regulator
MPISVLEQKVRERRRRMTRIRRAMLDIFGEADKPVTATDITEEFGKRRIPADRTTIYRELRFLAETGVIHEVRLQGRGRSFEIKEGHRHHLVCIGCQGVRSIYFDEHLEREKERLLEEERFQVLDHSLEFYGLCEKCAKQ